MGVLKQVFLYICGVAIQSEENAKRLLRKITAHVNMLSAKVEEVRRVIEFAFYLIEECHHHHHHHIFICLVYTIQKNLFTAVIARRRGDPGSHRAYGRATSLTLINKVKKKCCECAARPIQGLFK